jgi:hypothetical protein
MEHQPPSVFTFLIAVRRSRSGRCWILAEPRRRLLGPGREEVR